MSLKGPIAFVSGATGATGRAIVAQLANKNWRVVALTRQRNKNKLELFPEILIGKLSKVTLFYQSDPEDWSTWDPVLIPCIAQVEAVFLCHGTSREYHDVQQDIEEFGQEGFAKWLQRIDVDMTRRIAKTAVEGRVPVVVRISASKADPDHDPEAMGGFGLYFKYQGIADKEIEHIFEAGPSTFPVFGDYERREGDSRVLIFRPTSLDRGDEKRKNRPWEREIASKGERPTMPVSLFAQAIIGQVESRRKPKRVLQDAEFKIFSCEEVWALIHELNGNAEPGMSEPTQQSC